MTYPPPPPPGDQPPWPAGSQPPAGDQPPWGAGNQYPPPGGQPQWGQPPPSGPGYPPPGYQQAGYQQPGWNQQPQPGWNQQPGWSQEPRPGRAWRGRRYRTRRSRRNVFIGTVVGVVVLFGIGIIHSALGGSQSSSSSTFSPGFSGVAPSGPAASGKVGTTFKVTGTDDSGKPIAYDVTLVAVSQNAAPDNSFDGASAGHHLASAEFRITGITGSSHDDANLDANAHGSNAQAYNASFSGVAAGTNFSDGDFTVAPGQTEVGYVSFELPNSAQVSNVTWDPDLDGQSVATWTTGG
jgi:hypothetical protein